MKLRINGLGLALGFTWAGGVLFLGLSSALFSYGVDVVALLGGLYIGYAPTIVGAFTGALWAFVDGYLAGVVVAFLYNRFV